MARKKKEPENNSKNNVVKFPTKPRKNSGIKTNKTVIKSKKAPTKNSKSKNLKNLKNIKIPDLCNEIVQGKVYARQLPLPVRDKCIEFLRYDQKLSVQTIADIMGMKYMGVYDRIKLADLKIRETLINVGTFDRAQIAQELTLDKQAVQERLWKGKEYVEYYKVGSQWLKDLQSLGVIFEKPKSIQLDIKKETIEKFYATIETTNLEAIFELIQDIESGTKRTASNDSA